MTSENISVIELGEDSDLFIVTGTTDAHSADEAVRTYVEEMSGETIESLQGADELVEFRISYRTDWAWTPGPNEDDPMEEATLVRGERGNGLPRFAAYMVQA